MIEVKDLTVFVKKNIILDHINLTVHEGEICGIIGKNGCGKTFLMRCICGLYPYSIGNIKVDEKSIGTECDFPESLGLMIETPGFYDNMTGFENLRQLAMFKRKVGKQQIKEAMEIVGLDSELKTKVGKYSLGMRQKLGIAQAIMENPRNLVLDEPFNSLDEESHMKIIELLKEQKKEKTILITSHNKEDISFLCDRVVYMEHGKIIS